MTVLKVKHRTAYLYQAPVVLGEHRLMSRPRDSHDLRLLDTGLDITPPPSDLLGSFTGMPSDFLSLTVDVEVTTE